MKCKHYEIESRVEYFSEPIGDILRRYKTIKKYAYILHDKDADASPHYHIYVNFGKSGVDSKIVAQWFGVQESCVERIKGRATDMLLYLTHGQESQKHKYQYSPSEVIANFDFEAEIEKSKILGDFKKYSYAQQLKYIDTLPIAEKKTAFGTLEKLWKIHCQVLSLEPNRDIDVMFIYGKTGTGKTTYAKRYAEGRGYDCCISSSSNDPWQDYLGQKCMILDDMRDTTFDKFEDFLKIIDNHTSSSIQARYGNKVFSGELIIITSSVPLSYWYKFTNREDLKQMYRRITAYVEITREEIAVYSELDDFGHPTGVAAHFKNDIHKMAQNPKKKKTDFIEGFANICEYVPLEEVLNNKQNKRS